MQSIEALARSRHPSLLWKKIRPASAPPLDTTDDNDPLLPPRPLPNSYWPTPILLASEYPGDQNDEVAVMKLNALLDVGVRDFYDLTELGELRPYDGRLESIIHERRWEIDRGPQEDADIAAQPTASSPETQDSNTIEPVLVRYRRFPIPDGGLPDPPTLTTILHALSSSRARNRTAVIHCFGGIGRTGTLVGCWLVQGGYVEETPDGVEAGQKALDLLATKWKGVEKSWRAKQTPENARQMTFVRTFKPIQLG